MRTENEDYLYPAASVCWSCGLPVPSDRSAGYRRCDQCDVTWTEPIGGATDQAVAASVLLGRMQKLANVKTNYRFRPGEDFMDHGINTLDSPA